MTSNPLPFFFLGFLLGIRHAFDADHVVAISTMVTYLKNPFKATLIGVFWGLGHTSTLFLAGLTVLLFKVSIPFQAALLLETAVGVMLIILGISTIFKKDLPYHIHEHKHSKKEHLHAHKHELKNHYHLHGRSFFIGGIQGLAGSGALMLLVMSIVKDIWRGIIYILIFGLGSIGGMLIISLVLSLPYYYSVNKFPFLNKYLKLITGMLSIIFGLGVIYELSGLF